MGNLKAKGESVQARADRLLDAPWRRTAEWIQRLVAPESAVELRCVGVVRHGHREPHAESAHYRHEGSGLEGMARAALEITGRSEGVYWTLNPLSSQPALEGRPANAGDVLSRRWLLIDCDPVRRVADGQSKHCSATDAEKEAARVVSARIRESLSSKGWPEPVVADSGNGYHLLYRIDLPTDDEGLVKRVLTGLADAYDTDEVQIDRRLFDPPRISKLYGTLARKGEDTAERPHRPSSVLVMPESLDQVVTVEQLRDVAAPEPKTRKARATEVPPPPAEQPKKGGLVAKAGRPDARGRAEIYAQRCQPAIAGEGGHNHTLKVAVAVGPGFDLTVDEAVAVLAQHFNPRCEPPWSDKDLRRKVEQAYKIEPSRGWQLRVSHRPDAVDEGNSRVDATDETSLAEKTNDPHRLARAILANHYSHESSGRATLAYWRDEWHRWYRGAWHACSDREIAADVTGYVKEEVDRISRETQRETEPVTTRLTANVRQALQHLALIPTWAVPRQPAWLGEESSPGNLGPSGDPVDCLSTANAIVHLPSLVADRPCTWAPTPRFFSPGNLGYDFDPAAPAPQAWLNFLHDLWEDDLESIAALQEWMGYLLTPDTSQGKILMIIGPKRSGKGTIGRTINALVGPDNVAAPTLSGLATNFGLAPLIGKSVALIGDARLSGRADSQIIVERLLSISGQDPQTIDRKHLSSWTGSLPTRFILVSNELPRLSDASGALPSRMILLRMTKSFFGKEDTSLTDRILAERPAILLWAIAGWQRLRERGRFLQPESGRRLLDDLDDLCSPIASFLAEECVIGPDHRVLIGDLYARWKKWCESRGKDHPGDEQGFGRQLRASLPELEVSRPRSGGKQIRMYVGVSLADAGDEPF